MSHKPYDHSIEQIEAVALAVLALMEQKLTKTGEVYACLGMVQGLIAGVEIKNALQYPQNNRSIQ